MASSTPMAKPRRSKGSWPAMSSARALSAVSLTSTCSWRSPTTSSPYLPPPPIVRRLWVSMTCSSDIPTSNFAAAFDDAVWVTGQRLTTTVWFMWKHKQVFHTNNVVWRCIY
ncbi:hypothetical protein EJ110_NYTH49882 [Nymphaea thermarum]|nr:hypothetical protein EJ110_NYTH49882 [Nymphaea thermarum]